MRLKIKDTYSSHIQTLTSTQVINGVYFEDIQRVMLGDKDQKFSIKTKANIFYIISVCIPLSLIIALLSGGYIDYQIILGVLAECIIIINMTKLMLQKPDNYLKYSHYEYIRYSIVKYAYLSIFAMGYGMNEGLYVVNFFVVTTCIIVFLYLYKKVEENMILLELNKKYNTKFKISKFMNILMKLTGVLVLITFIFVSFYRINKWWLNSYINVNSSNNNSLLDNLIGIFIGIPILLLITLIPTYFLFNAKDYVISESIKNHSEEFRQRYDYSKKEWYGDN